MHPLQLPASSTDRDAWDDLLHTRCDAVLEQVRTAQAALGDAGARREDAEVLRLWGDLSIALLNPIHELLEVAVTLLP